MSYDHSKKIGNEGDLVKHVVLHNCTTHLLANNPISEQNPFIYFECHAGRPHYILPEKGEWKNGIGSLIGGATIEERSKKASVDSFCKAHLQNDVSSGMQYFGSSNIVFRTIRASTMEQSFKIILHDTDPDVIDDLASYFAPWISQMSINQSSGYLGLSSILKNSITPSLVLLDPPSLETTKISPCIKILREKKISYICWTPRTSAQNPPANDRPIGFQPSESQSSIKFGSETDLGKHIGVSWGKPTGHTKNSFGCRLTVSEDLYDVSKKCVDDLVDIMSQIKPKKNGKTTCWKIA
jgi:23S rRNA A2030 N6-methylase RlmJ